VTIFRAYTDFINVLDCEVALGQGFALGDIYVNEFVVGIANQATLYYRLNTMNWG
jgi:hypothetical protein